jgi:hypothetical protein
MSYAVIPLGAPHGGGGGGHHGGGGHGGGGHGGGGGGGMHHGGHRRPINVNVNAGPGFGPGYWPGYTDGGGYLYAVEDDVGVSVYVKQNNVWNPVAQGVDAEQARVIAQTWTAKGFEVKIG